MNTCCDVKIRLVSWFCMGLNGARILNIADGHVKCFVIPFILLIKVCLRGRKVDILANFVLGLLFILLGS